MLFLHKLNFGDSLGTWGYYCIIADISQMTKLDLKES